MSQLNIADVKLNYDPSEPQQRFRDTGLEAAFAEPSAQLPVAPPWPSDGKPQPMPLTPAPAETDDLTRFSGYDAVIITWTSAEAAALAALLTPGYKISAWYEYRHNIADYIPLVTGAKAPFNINSAETARYYHSLGLYFPCQIGASKVLLFKSGLHLDYDGPATPVRKLMLEIATAVQPSLFITTGTGGGIGADVLLGDVIIAGDVRFDCTTQFKNEPWHDATYTPSPLPAGTLQEITSSLLDVNASRVPKSRSTPKIWSAPTDAIVTTDFFGFDDSTDFYKLQGLGRVCDMGDAMVANALQAVAGLSWHAVRNASDPQIPNPDNDIEKAAQQAAQIYARYGGLTTAASVIASWAIVHAATKNRTTKSDDSEKRQAGPTFKLGRLEPVRNSSGETIDPEVADPLHPDRQLTHKF